MFITTNLGFDFRRLDDVIRYMEEEKIEKVKLGYGYWGAVIPQKWYSLNDVREELKSLKELDK